MHDATSSWNHRGRLGPRQAQQPPKEEAAASPDATTTAARHLELPCTPPQPPPDEKPVAISSTAGPQSVGQALAVIDDESCSTPAIQNALTATVAGLERRIEDNCLSLTKHYLQELALDLRTHLATQRTFRRTRAMLVVQEELARHNRRLFVGIHDTSWDSVDKAVEKAVLQFGQHTEYCVF